MAQGVQLSDLNWIAILAAMASNIVLGFLWYSPKLPTGKIWMRAMKIPADLKPTPKQMVLSLVLMLIGTFLLMFVLQHVFLAFRDSYQLDGRTTGLSIMDGVMGAVFTWVGFFVPLHLTSVAWEGKPWSLFFVNATYYLVTLLIAGIIFALMLGDMATPA